MDAAATRDLSDPEKVRYLECLIKVAKAQDKPEHNRILAAFGAESTSVMRQRFELVLSDKTDGPCSRLENLKQVLFVTFFVVLAFLSYAVVFEPCTYNEELLAGTYTLTKDNSFIVKNSENGYDLYIDNQYNGPVNDITLEVYCGLPLYENLQEAL